MNTHKTDSLEDIHANFTSFFIGNRKGWEECKPLHQRTPEQLEQLMIRYTSETIDDTMLQSHMTNPATIVIGVQRLDGETLIQELSWVTSKH